MFRQEKLKRAHYLSFYWHFNAFIHKNNKLFGVSFDWARFWLYTHINTYENTHFLSMYHSNGDVGGQ